MSQVKTQEGVARFHASEEHGSVSLCPGVRLHVSEFGTEDVYKRQSEATMPYARDFMEVILLGNPIAFTFIGLNNLMRATGYPKKAMLSSLLTVMVNIILAPIFIFHFEWGIRGAAFATVIAQSSGLVWILAHFLNKNSSVHFKAGIFKLKAVSYTHLFCS